MSYQERRSLVNLGGTILITVLYSAYMLQRHPAGDPYAPAVFHFWGEFFLILIPVTIVAKILTYIAFSIVHTIATREAEPAITDERDRLIEMKAAQYSLYVFALGFLLGMGSLVLSMTPSVMFVILIGAGLLSEVVGDLSQFLFYRRGF